MATPQTVIQITVVDTEPGMQNEALGVMAERANFMMRQPGFVSVGTYRSLDGHRIVNRVEWKSRDLLHQAHRSPEFRKEWRRFDSVTDDIEPQFYEVAKEIRA